MAGLTKEIKMAYEILQMREGERAGRPEVCRGCGGSLRASDNAGVCSICVKLNIPRAV